MLARGEHTRRQELVWLAWIQVAVLLSVFAAIAEEAPVSPAGGVCQELPVQSRDISLFQGETEDAQAADWVIPPLLEAPEADGVRAGQPGKPRGLRYSVSDGVTAGVSYSHTRLPETASNEELRKYRLGGFSTAPERDVLDLGMSWDIGESSSVGVGYQLQSIRPDTAGRAAGEETRSILPQSEGLDHAVTFGVRRSWGGDD
jgi:hypothetical protein